MAQKDDNDDDEKGWNLEDETGFDEDDEATPAAQAAAQPKQEDAMDLAEGGDEIDPLDAFMAENDAQVEPVKMEEDAAAPQGDQLHFCMSPLHALDMSIWHSQQVAGSAIGTV